MRKNIIAAIQDVFNIDKLLVKAVSSLSGGLCLSGEGPCGGYLAGLIIISFYFGRDRDNFSRLGYIVKSSKIGLELNQYFLDKYGSIYCKDIQKKLFGRQFNLLNNDDFSEFERMGGHDIKCPEVVGNSAVWAVEVLLRNKAIVI